MALMEPPYESFTAIMEAVVLPRMLASPGDIRLDGEQSGGNWSEAGRFRFDGGVWRLFEDNRYEPLLLAYYSARCRGEDLTFVRGQRQRSDGIRLNLVPELEAVRPTKPGSYLYLYPEE